MLESFDRRPLIAEELEQADDERIAQVREAAAVTGSARCPWARPAARSWTSVALFAHRSALRRSSHLQIIFSDSRLRFSRSTRRSMVGKAQSSPIDQRGPFLKRPDKPCDAGLVQLAVGVGDQLQGQA